MVNTASIASRTSVRVGTRTESSPHKHAHSATIDLQQKVNVVLEYRARQEVLQDAEEKEALAEKEEATKKKK